MASSASLETSAVSLLPHSSHDMPDIDALFLIRFDIRKGYTIAWKESLPGVELDGAVEYKSLPSGLHNVQEDLVYFIHDGYAGLSAFINEPADEASRNALMLAVGVLLPLGESRMGKSWMYTEPLKTLCRDLANDPENTKPLESFWHSRKRKSREGEQSSRFVDGQEGSSKIQPHQGYKRNRGMSDAPAKLGFTQTLSDTHPATSLPAFLQAFGPLVFPLYRAALLRKRILLVGEAPVHINCNYVYDLSILASMPQNVLDLLPYDVVPDLRLKTLFNVGIYDISSLSPSPNGTTPEGFPPSWVACTTDDVLVTKPQLYDILVKLPPPYAKDAPRRAFPQVFHSNPAMAISQKSVPQLKATQRDARRYHTLNYHLQRPPFSGSATNFDASQPSIRSESTSSDLSTFSTTSIVEPISWSLAAYNSFVWWASAGEKRATRSQERENEVQQDEDLLLQDLPDSDSVSDVESSQIHSTSIELALIAYFQRLTSLIMGTLSEAIERQEYESDQGQQPDDRPASRSEASSYTGRLHEGENSDNHPLLRHHEREAPDAVDRDEPVVVHSDDMMHIGLDPWSSTDRAFVEDMLSLWWGRKAHVRTAKVECCGVQIL